MSETRDQIVDMIEKSIRALNKTDSEKADIVDKYESCKENPINILVLGSTGSGKSSTINAIVGKDIAKVGVTPTSETNSVVCYKLGNIVFWDSPGLGDGSVNDKLNTEMIINKLNETYDNGQYVIDLVLVVLDASTKDLSTPLNIISNIIIPNLGNDPYKRIIVGLNQMDNAMKGRYWNIDNNRPEKNLIEFMIAKANYVQEIIKSTSGIVVNPISYVAGYKDNNKQLPSFNIHILIYYIIKFIPKEKRKKFTNDIVKNNASIRSSSIVDELKELLAN